MTVLRSFVVAAVAALAVAGCGGESPSTTPGSASSSTAAATSESASPSATGTPDLPSGSQWVEAEKTGIRFPVPEDWKPVSFREVLESGDQKAIAEAAETMGVSVEQLSDLADQIEVIVLGPTLKNFAVNVNVIPQPGVAMPSAEQASSQLEQIGGKVGTPTTGTTAFGASLVVPYTLDVRGTTVQGRSILLETPDGIATLTVSHVAADEADQLTQAILDNVGQL